MKKQGLVKTFEYTYELAWNSLKDFLEYSGQTDIYGSRAMGNYRPGSDIDLTFTGEKLNLKRFNKISLDLDGSITRVSPQKCCVQT